VGLTAAGAIGLLIFAGALARAANFRCTFGYPTQWKAPRRFLR